MAALSLNFDFRTTKPYHVPPFQFECSSTIQKIVASIYIELGAYKMLWNCEHAACRKREKEREGGDVRLKKRKNINNALGAIV